MRFKSILLLIMLFSLKYSTSFGQSVCVIKFDSLQNVIFTNSDTTYVVNFFASWCAPCLKEIPEFLKFADSVQNKNVRLILVSLDLKKDYEKSINPIILKYNIKQTIYLLDDPDANSWISKVDSAWSGSIPATLFINNKTHFKRFFETPMTYKTLLNNIE